MSDNPALTMALSGVKALDASAGTGKTYSIALIHLRLVLAGIPVERILVSTFTNAAAAELRERLRLRLAEARDELAGGEPRDATLRDVLGGLRSGAEQERARSTLDRALSAFDTAPICTIHGFCTRLLRDHALELGASTDREIAASDPRLDQRVGDFLARATETGQDEEDPTKPPTPQALLTIARNIREYNPTLRGTLDRADYLAQAEAQWMAETTEHLRLAREAWNGQRGSIETALRHAVETGVINAGVFDNPNTDKEPTRWKKLRSSVEETTTLVSSPDPPGRAFPAGVKRLLPDALRKAAAEGARLAVNTLIRNHSFFEHLESLAQAHKERSAVLEAAGTRGLTQPFLEDVAQLGPEGPLLYSDLINLVFRSLGNGALPAAVRASFDAVLVDECQDTDARQLEIFRQLFGHPDWIGDPPKRALVWVGDPKQSIYRFRGADIETYVRAQRDADRLTLDANYRSDKPLVELVNALFKGPGTGTAPFGPCVPFVPSQSRHDVRIRDGESGGVPAFCLHTWRTDGDPPSKGDRMGPSLRDCARQIRQLLRSNVEIDDGGWRRIQAGDIAVLAAERRQLEGLRRELLRLGIPAAYRTDSSIYLEEEARDLAVLLQALATTRPSFVRAALSTPLFGHALNDVVRMSETEVERAQEQLLGMAEQLTAEGILPVLSALLRDRPRLNGGTPGEPALVRLARRPDGERTLTNLTQLAELLQAAWRDRHARSADALKGFLDLAMSQARQRRDAESTEEAKLRLETDAPAVVLSTIHTSKGLQYPVVFIPALWTQRAVQPPPCIVTHEEDGNVRLVLPGDPDWQETFKDEKRRLEAEQMRLLYVALTRARHQLHVWWGRVRHDARWTVSSTRTAFGQLLWEQPLDAESYSDDECLEAFQQALERAGKAGYGILHEGEPAPWCRPAARTDAPIPAPPVAGNEVQPAEWTRGRLPAEPLQSSYSALLRKQSEGHRADDEVALTETDEPSPPDPGPADRTADVLEPFQGGKTLGDRVHCAFETAMAGDDPATAGTLFVQTLAPDLSSLLRKGRGPSDTRSAARELWDRTVGSDVGCGSVGDLLRHPHVPEWEFLLPQEADLTPSSLTAHMTRFGAGSPWGDPGYTERVRQLGFVPLSGYFEGIVDLLGQGADGRWVLADYKTNRLDHYGPRSLAAAMAECHYLLQALLYTVAVNRWLAGAIPGWSYDRDFAGAAYLFLRGMQAGTRQGVWTGKPPAALVTALDGLFRAGGSVVPR